MQPSAAPSPRQVVVVEQTVFTSATDQPEGAHPSNFCRPVRSDEMPYAQDFKATPEWRPLPLGWLQGNPISFVKVENKRRRNQVIPSPEEEAADAALVIELGYRVEDHDGAALVVPFARVRPGEDTRAEYLDPARVHYRCPAGECKGRLTVYPD